MTTLNEFYDILNSHDWYFNYSDDHRVWTRGNRALNRIRHIAAESGQHNKLFQDFQNHHFSGEAFNTPKQPKPERPHENQKQVHRIM